jgi:hypothetical protein
MYIHVHVHVALHGVILCIIALPLYDVHVSTHKVVGISTVSRTDHLTAQTRELECTRRVLPQVMERGMLYRQ